MNTITYSDLTVNGLTFTDGAALLRCNGSYNRGIEKTFTMAQMAQVYQAMGPGYTMAEDPIWWSDNKNTLIYTNCAHTNVGVMGYLNAGMWFTEYDIPWYPLQAGGTTTADSKTIPLIVQSCQANGIGLNGTVVLTRAYGGKWVSPLTTALENPQVSGIEVEASPIAAIVNNWGIGLLAQKTLAAGKSFYLLMPPGNGPAPYDYGAQVAAYAQAFSSYVNLADDRIFFIPAIYGGTALGVTWLGTTNSIYEAISLLKAMPQWERENLVGNGSFEAPNLASASNSSDPPAGTGWTFNSFSGIESNGSRACGAADAPDGTQAAFLQCSTGQNGSISQTITFPSAGLYVATFQAAKCTKLGATQSFNVEVDGAAVGTFSPTSGSFTPFSTDAFTISTAGAHTLSFVGTISGANSADFIDSVSITVPPPIVSGHTYQITNQNSQLALDIPGSSNTPGTQLDQNASTGGSNQEWTFYDLGDGYWTINSASNGLVLDVSTASTTPGASVVENTPGGAPSQEWSLCPGAGESWKLVNRKSRLVIGIDGGSSKVGAGAVQSTDWEGRANQQWSIQPYPSPPVAPVVDGGTYVLTNQNSKLVLDDPGFSYTLGTQLDQYSIISNSNQQWIFTSLGNGYWSITSPFNGLAVGVSGASTTPGTAVEEDAPDGGTSKQWSFARVGDGSWKLINRKTGLIIGVDGGSTTSGALAVQWNDTNESNQHWNFDLVAPEITSELTASGTPGSAFSYQITGTSIPTSYAASGLPAGLSVNTSTGAITGTLTALGTSNVTISATNAAGTGSATLVITAGPVADGIYKLISRTSGLALDNNDDGPTNAVEVLQSTDAAATNTNQQWQITALGNGYYSLLSMANFLALDNAGSATDGTHIWQFGYLPTNPNQQWQITKLSNGYYSLVNNTSGKALDNTGGTATKTPVRQSNYDPSNSNQQWAILAPAATDAAPLDTKE